MEPTILGLVLNSSVLVAAERRNLTPAQVIEDVVKAVGAVPIIISSLTIAEIGYGIYRANTLEIRDRRRAFLDELKATIPIHSITEATAEIIVKGINLPTRRPDHWRVCDRTRVRDWNRQRARL